MYIYKNYELEHYEIEYIRICNMKLNMNMWIWNYTIYIQYEYIYMNSYMHIQCIQVYELITKLQFYNIIIKF